MGIIFFSKVKNEIQPQVGLYFICGFRSEFAHTGDEGQTSCSNIQSCLVEHGDGLSVS